MAIRHDLTTTTQLRSAATERVAEARRLGDTYIGVKHLLLGMLAVEGAAAPEILREFGCDLDVLKTALDAVADERPAGADPKGPNRLPLTREAERALSQAFKVASRLGSERVGTEHLLLGLLARRLGGLGPSSAVAELLSGQCGVTYRKVRKSVKERGVGAA